MLMVVIAMIATAYYMPTYAASNNEVRADEPATSEQSGSSSSGQPDTLSEYALQQVKWVALIVFDLDT